MANNSISHDIFLKEMDGIPFSIANLSITIVWEIILIVFLIVIISLIVRWKLLQQKQDIMRRNQKIMLAMVVLLIIIQIIGLTFRVCYSAIDVSITSKSLNYIETHYATNSSIYQDAFVNGNSTFVVTIAGANYSDVVAQQVMNGLQMLCQLGNVVFLMIIMGFIGIVFLRTVSLIHNFNPRIAIVVYITLTVTFSMTSFLAVVAVAIVQPFIKLKLVVDFLLYLYLVGYLVFFLDIVLHLCIVIIISIRVLLAIKSNQSKIGDNTPSKQAFVKVIILQITLILSALIQIVAIGFGALVPQNVFFALAYIILNTLGIFLFTVISLALYFPIFTFGANLNNNQQA